MLNLLPVLNIWTELPCLPTNGAAPTQCWLGSGEKGAELSVLSLLCGERREQGIVRTVRLD